MSGRLSLDAESLYQTLCKGVGAMLTPDKSASRHHLWWCLVSNPFAERPKSLR